MRLGDLDALKRAIEDRIDQIPANDFDVGWNNAINAVIDEIDNAPAVTSKVEFVTKNGITFPKALKMITYSHELTTEERQNIERAYMLGVYSNEIPQGEWNNHTVACLLAELFGDSCACNHCGIDEWLPKKCDFANKECPDVVGVACWEQFLKHRKGGAEND